MKLFWMQKIPLKKSVMTILIICERFMLFCGANEWNISIRPIRNEWLRQDKLCTFLPNRFKFSSHIYSGFSSFSSWYQCTLYTLKTVSRKKLENLSNFCHQQNDIFFRQYTKFNWGVGGRGGEKSNTWYWRIDWRSSIFL